MALGIILGLGAAASGAYGAYSANKGKEDALAQQEAIAEQLGVTQGTLEGLFNSQHEPSDPVAVFTEILQQYPELLSQMLPTLRKESVKTSQAFTKSNVRSFQDAIKALYPDYSRLSAEQVRIIDQLNPDNLGQEEIQAITRKLSPLIPAGTLDPNTGAVAGGTTSPVSLYRNLISSEYNDRRSQYLGALGGYIANAENSAYRQEEKASSFLPSFLNLGFSSANSLAGMTLRADQMQMAQDQANISSQMGLLQTLLGLGSNINTSQYDQAAASSLNNVFAGLASAYQSYKSPTGTFGGGGSAGGQTKTLDLSKTALA